MARAILFGKGSLDDGASISTNSLGCQRAIRKISPGLMACAIIVVRPACQILTGSYSLMSAYKVTFYCFK